MNKKIGAIFIVSGTSIGAGMLALPIEARAINFSTSILLLISVWLWTLFTALYTTDLFIQFKDKKTFPDLSGAVLGTAGKWVSLLSFAALHYSLLGAYTAGSSDILSLWINKNLSYFIFIIPISILSIYAYKAVDITNRILFISKIVIFTILIFYLLPKFSMPSDTALSLKNVSGSLIAIAFTSFGFHGSIPFIINYLGSRDKKELYQVFTIGSLVPLIVYILWMTSIYGTIEILPESLHFLVEKLSSLNFFSKLFINLFSLLAILTSFIGVFLSLFDLNLHVFKNNKTMTVLATSLPPLFFVLFYPNGFIFALRYAAACLAIFAVIVPFAISFKLKKSLVSFLFLLSGVGIVLFG